MTTHPARATLLESLVDAARAAFSQERQRHQEREAAADEQARQSRITFFCRLMERVTGIRAETTRAALPDGHDGRVFHLGGLTLRVKLDPQEDKLEVFMLKADAHEPAWYAFGTLERLGELLTDCTPECPDAWVTITCPHLGGVTRLIRRADWPTFQRENCDWEEAQ